MSSPISAYIVRLSGTRQVADLQISDPRHTDNTEGAQRLSEGLDRALKRPQGTPTQRAVRRYECIKAITAALIDEKGSFDPSALHAVRLAIGPGTDAAAALGGATARLIRMRLDDLEQDVRLTDCIHRISQSPVHDSVRHLLRLKPHDFSDPTPRELAMEAIRALMDGVRQRDAPNCWVVARKLQKLEDLRKASASSNEVLAAIESMLWTGTTGEGGVAPAPQTTHLPISDPAGWNAKLPAGKISLMILMNRMPAYEHLEKILALDPLALADRLNKASLSISKGKKRYITAGKLIEFVIMERHQLSGDDSKRVRAQEDGKKSKMNLDQARQKLANVRSDIDAILTAMAAKENSLLLAAWATTAPASHQDSYGYHCMQAVSDVLKKSKCSLSATQQNDAVEKLQNAFRKNVQIVLSRADRGQERLFTFALRSDGFDRPRVEAGRSEQQFRAMMLELLKRARTDEMLSEEKYEWLLESIGTDFPGRVAQSYTKLLSERWPGVLSEKPRSPWADFVDWNEAKVLRPRKADHSSNLLKVYIADEAVGLHPALPGKRQQSEKANLEGWLDLMKIVSTSREHCDVFFNECSGGTLIAEAADHMFRLLPMHESWSQGWMNPPAGQTSAEWIKKNVIAPAAAEGRQRLGADAMHQLITELLADVRLNKGASAKQVARDVIELCNDTQLFKAGAGGAPLYRVDRVVRQLAQLLTTDNRCAASRDTVRDLLSAAIQMHPTLGRGMVVFADSNWRDDKGHRKGTTMDPLLLGFGYDFLEGLRQWVLTEKDGGPHPNRVRWCEPCGSSESVLITS
jgi:hypothetical protein